MPEPIAPPVGYPPTIYLVDGDNHDNATPELGAALSSGTYDVWVWQVCQQDHASVCEDCGDPITPKEWHYRETSARTAVHLRCMRGNPYLPVFVQQQWP